jgi:glucokinase
MYIGIDLGGTNIAAGLVNDNCEIISKKSIPTNASRQVEEIIKDMAILAQSLVEENGISKDDISWVGIGSPGTVDTKNGVIIYANNIKFRNTPAADIFRKYYDIPVFLGNDANCAALGEAYAGAAKGCDSAVAITLGTGLGGGIIIDRKIYAGFNGAGGELGHMVIVKDGVQCTCGRKGCWEAYSSATGLIRMTVEAMKTDTEKKSMLWNMLDGGLENVSGKSAYLAARQGDALAISVVDNYQAYLACGITNIINIFQPQIFCIGGGVSHEGDNLLKPLSKLIFRETYTRKVTPTVLKLAILGNSAGIVGAAMLGK